jgi:integrase
MATKQRRRGHGEGAVFQRGDGLWVARLNDPNGKRKTLYAKTRKEAADKLRAAQKSVDDGLSLDTGRQTAAQFLDKWLAASVKPSVKTKTYEGYESIVRVRVNPRMGGKHLAKLTALDLQALYTDLANAGLSPRSVHHTHRCLHRAFVQAVRWNLIARNPCDGAQGPQATRPEMMVWTPQEADTFLISTREHPAHALYTLALTTGMRQGELLGLKWADVDLSAGTLSIRRSLQRQRGAGPVLITLKTARSRRSIHLSQRAIAALRTHSDRQAFDRRAAGAEWVEHDLVFCHANGEPLDPSYQTATFKKAAEAAGVPVIRFHDMRHTAATVLLAKGVHVKVVSEMLGHATITLTLDTYSHVIPAMQSDAAAAMDAVFTA